MARSRSRSRRRKSQSPCHSRSRGCRSRSSSRPRPRSHWEDSGWKKQAWKRQGWKDKDWNNQSNWSSHDWNADSSSQHEVTEPQPTQLGEPLVFEPEAGSCEGALIFLHGIGDRPANWSKTFAPLRAHPSHRRWLWVHLRAPKLWLACRGYKMSAWGRQCSNDCMHVGSEDHKDQSEYQSAAEAVRLEVERLQQEYGVPSGKVLIAGFSQGAAVSLLAALTYPQLFTGCVALSGWLLPSAQNLLMARTAPSGPPILLCHGTADESIGHDCAEDAALHLRNAGQQLQFESFAGLGHAHSHVCNGLLMNVITKFVHGIMTGQGLQAASRSE